MWCLDAYRAAGVSPRRVGRRRDPSPEAANRGKGQWFKTLLIALLGERTPQRLATRTIVPGFSQAAGSTVPGHGSEAVPGAGSDQRRSLGLVASAGAATDLLPVGSQAA